MELEQRIQALEQELEILKNQIQATLLGVQEQQENSASPAPRAEPRPSPASGKGGSSGRKPLPPRR